MSTNQLQVDIPEVQAAIYRVALSLDSFLLNGIPHGVMHRDVFAGFLQKLASGLLQVLANLDEQALCAPVTSPDKVKKALSALRAKVQQLIDLANELTAFRTLTLSQVRSLVSQIPRLRSECVDRIQELEDDFRTPKRFYQSRPAHSTASVNDFLSNLETAFAQEWNA